MIKVKKIEYWSCGYPRCPHQHKTEADAVKHRSMVVEETRRRQLVDELHRIIGEAYESDSTMPHLNIGYLEELVLKLERYDP
jgi:hypothetical protein